jgi:hypothetical protein
MTNVSSISKCKTNDKESWLNYEMPQYSQDQTGSEELNIAIDSGSTYTRFAPFDNEEMEIGTVRELNSDVLEVGDITMLKSASKALYSNMEFIVRDVTVPSEKPEKIFNEAHFVKGDLLVGMPGAKVERNSRVSKVETKTTYYNILSAITLNVLESVNNGGELKACYRVHLAMTLPPRDLKSKFTVETLKNRLKGHYTVTMPRVGVKINIRIEDDIWLENEPTAIIYDIASNEAEDVERSIMDKTAIIVDGGGGTTDMAVVIGGQLVDAQADTNEFGGKLLLDSIARIYQSETGRSKPELSAVEDSLVNGILIRGNSNVDVFSYVDVAKEQVAQSIYNSINGLCDMMQKSLDDIEEVILHGRLFGDTVTVDGKVSSIASKLNNKLKSLAPDIKVSVLKGDQYVCEGAVTSLWVGNS